MTDRQQDDQWSEEDDVELDEAVGHLYAVERARRKRTAIIGVAVLVVFGALFWWMAQHTDKLFRPNIDAAAGEQELLEETGDPVCRQMIADIDEMADDFAEREFDFEDGIWGDDVEQVDQLKETATAFRSRLDRIRDRSKDAVFREEDAPDLPPVPEQVEEWFGNMDNEFRILEDMGERRLRMLRDEELEERGGLWNDPQDLRNTVLMTIDENFAEFRVWVTRGGHPCGAPPEGVEPWQPEDGELVGP